MKKILQKLNDPNFALRFHACMAIFFILLTIPAATWWANSVPFLVAISMWALIAAHWSAYQASHGEKTQKEDNDADFAKLNEKIDQLTQLVVEVRNNR